MTRIHKTPIELELQLFQLKHPHLKGTILNNEVLYIDKSYDGRRELPFAAPKWATDGDASLDLIAEYDMQIAFVGLTVCVTRMVEDTEHAACEPVQHTADDCNPAEKKRAIKLAVLKLAIALEEVAASMSINS